MQKNILNVALYISLFPQLIAGPIVRYQTVADEIEVRSETLSGAASGVRRFCLGLGIDPGIRFFKRKWHARPALPCLETGWSTRATTPGGGWFSRLRRLLGGEEAA